MKYARVLRFQGQLSTLDGGAHTPGTKESREEKKLDPKQSPGLGNLLPRQAERVRDAPGWSGWVPSREVGARAHPLLPRPGTGVGGAARTVPAGPLGPHLVRVQVGVGLAQTVQEGFRVPAQRLPGGEEVGAADVEPDPLGHAAGALGQSAGTRAAAAAQAAPQPRPEAAWSRRRQLAVILRHDPSKPQHSFPPPEASGL